MATQTETTVLHNKKHYIYYLAKKKKIYILLHSILHLRLSIITSGILLYDRRPILRISKYNSM